MFPYTTDRREALRAAIGTRIDMGIFLSEGQVWGVVEAVRNLLLNWSLELEKAGVLGEEMSFTDAEKAEASTVTQQFIIQNVGVLGNVSGSAKVSNEQTATTSLDAAAVRDFADQAMRNLSSLPEEIRRELEPLIKEIHSELSQKRPDAARLREYLTSAKTIAEGALGNLAASGVVAMIGRLLGA